MSAVEAVDSAALSPVGRSRAAVLGSKDFSWRVLALLNLFRLGIGLLLLAAYFLLRDPAIIGDENPRLALGAIVALLASGIGEIWFIRTRQPSVDAQVFAELISVRVR